MRLLAASAVMATLLLGASPTVAQGPPLPPPVDPRVMGTLIVESDPPAEIVMDREITGLWTPQVMGLRPGHHTVTLVRRERRPSTYGFTIEAGKTTRLTIHLAPW
jgi:hypothetical protein